MTIVLLVKIAFLVGTLALIVGAVWAAGRDYDRLIDTERRREADRKHKLDKGKR